MNAEDLSFLAFMIGGLLALVVIAVGITYVVNGASCRATAEVMRVPARFSLLTDCMIEFEGRWIPLDSYRAAHTKEAR